MDTDLASRLDRSIGPSPAGDDGLTALLDRGHRAVARRRLAGGGASVLALLVVAGGLGLAASGGPEHASAPIAGDPSPTPAAPTPTEAWDHQLATFDPRTGAVVVADGVTVTERIENPYGVPAPAQSLGLALEKDGTTYWYVLYRGADTRGGLAGGVSMSEEADRGTLANWLQSHADIVTANDPAHDLVTDSANAPPDATPDPGGGLL